MTQRRKIIKRNFVYGLVDPRNDQVRYIGKTEEGYSRLSEHLKPRSLAKDTRKDRWLKQLISLGLKPIFNVLEEFDNPDVLFEAEEFWEDYYRFLGANLTNSVKCGGGTRGYKHKNETIDKLKEKAIARDKTNYQNPHNKKANIMVNGELYRNCSDCNIDKPISDFGWVEKQHRFQSYCIDCKRLYNTKWHEANPSETLPQEEYNATRLPGAIAGGETSKTPERREQARQQRSKAVQGVHIETGEIITFESALKAKEAGFQNSNLGQAIKYNKPYKSYRWSFITE
jgi:hypothetical protein